MGLFEKFKNIFTEEVVEDVPIKKEVMQVEIPAPKIEEEKIEIKKEEKFVFPVYFDDKDFDTITPKKEEIKKEEPKKEIYKGNTPSQTTKNVKKDKKFVPSPVISPVYGVLNKNYTKEEVVTKPLISRTDYYKPRKELSLDDVRKKAFGTLEDELENSLFHDDPIYTEQEVDYFEEMEQENKTEPKEEVPHEEVITTMENKIIDDFMNEKPDTSLEDNMTLEALNRITDEEEELKITESDLFNLIDSMYDKGDEEKGNSN